jgi:hypothetical protein
MNTPKTKVPKRYSTKRLDPIKTPDGTYSSGIWNTKIVTHFGQIAGYWPHVEDAMIDVLKDLLGGQPSTPARQIFRSVISNAARKKMMTAVLERSSLNVTKTQFYDDILEEFGALNARRNTYVHGLWYTHNGHRVFLCEESLDDFHHFEAREVHETELAEFFTAMDNFIGKIRLRRRQGTVAPRPLPETLPLPPAMRNKKAHRAQRTKTAKS